jgi:membrane protein required for colicin V production
MNWLDILILVGLGISSFIGLRTGLIKAVITLVGLIGGVVLAGRYYDSLGEWLSSYIPQANLAEVAAFAAILIGSLVAAAVLASFLQRVISLMMLGWVNRLGGAILGFLMGAVVFGALLTVIVKFPFFDVEDFVRGSAVASVLLQRFPVLLGLLPEEFDAVKSFFA